MAREVDRHKSNAQYLDRTIEALIHSQNFNEAFQAARAIVWSPSRIYSLGYLAAVMAQAGDPCSSEVFEEARELAFGVQPLYRGAYLRDLAAAMAETGDPRAFDVFEEAHQALIASGISSYYHKAEAFSKLATAMAQAGDGRSTQVFKEAVELALHVPNASIRYSSLFSTAEAMIAVGDKHVRQFFNVVLQNVVAPDNDFEHDFERVWALCNLASICANYLRRFPS
jgi:hypothetical protein